MGAALPFPFTLRYSLQRKGRFAWLGLRSRSRSCSRMRSFSRVCLCSCCTYPFETLASCVRLILFSLASPCALGWRRLCARRTQQTEQKPEIINNFQLTKVLGFPSFSVCGSLLTRRQKVQSRSMAIAAHAQVEQRMGAAHGSACRTIKQSTLKVAGRSMTRLTALGQLQQTEAIQLEAHFGAGQCAWLLIAPA